MGRRSWKHIRRYADDSVTVPEQAGTDAARLRAANAGIVAEPSGAMTTAAPHTHRHALPAAPGVAVVSGGNVQRRPGPCPRLSRSS
jgi:threonine dehydratase